MKRLSTFGITITVAYACAICGCGNSSTDTEDYTNCVTDIAWYSDNASGTAVEVATKEANAFGLYDMLGNAVEWVSDCYHETYSSAPDDGTSWDESSCEYRVVRGGCYGSTERGVRVSVRDGVTTGFYGSCAPGVRCVREAGLDSSSDTLTWVEIPTGSFVMGCSQDDSSCYSNEYPTHLVTVSAFAMTAAEVTQQEYYDQTGDSPSSSYCPDCAVTYVSWDEAEAFCEAVGGRLPTEAEWEYAARAGTVTPYYCDAQ